MAHNYDRSGEALSNPLSGDEVVITGIAGRFPQSNNVDDFFDKIMDKRDLLSKIPKEWDILCQNIPRRIGTLNEKRKFDAGYFGFNYYQAEVLNPTHRILLESTVEAIVDAGLHPSDLKGTKTGVYLGLFLIDFEIPWLHYNLRDLSFGITGSLRSTLPQLIAHHFGLEGPTVCIDSACSSSGYALEHAFRAIRSGKCDNAIVGGANLILAHQNLNQALRLGMLDPQAENNIFGENGRGYVRADGVSVVFLQKSKTSKRIYAQILHSKTNVDGYKVDGILHPSGKSQAALLREVYQEAGVNVSEINYIEAHSTGTKAGDPQEIGAINDVFCQNRMVPLTVGSVKSNMGHAESVSGLCSLIKVVMAMQTGWMPPNISRTNIRNDVSGFRNGKVRVAKEPFDIQNEEIIGKVYGGANSHIIVKRIKQDDTALPSQVNLVCVNARTRKGLAQLLASIVLKSHDKGYIALLQNIFRKDTDMFHYRGFAIVLNDKVVHRSCGKRPRLQARLGLSFGGAMESCTEGFVGIPIFSQILTRVKSCWDLKGWYEKPTYMQSIVVQIALVEFLDFLELPIEFVHSSSTGVIAGAYAEKLITLEEALSIAFQLSNGSNSNEYTPHSLAKSKTESLLKCIIEESEITNNALASFILSGGTYHVMKVTDTHSLLMSLGRLYEIGFNPTISKLYSVCDLPVKAPTISPLLRWDHDEDWFIPKPICHAKHGTEIVSISLDSVDEYWKFLMGHVIDGRNLLPATALIYIVLETFLKREGLLISEAKVLLERIKLHRIVILPKSGNIELTVQIFKQSNGFEITHGNELLVSGYLRLLRRACDYAIECTPMATSIEQPLTLNSIYKQLNLQHYHYRDQFRGLLQVDMRATQARIKWTNNWITFIDHMITMVFLKKNYRDLALPTSIDRLVIDAQRHLGTSEMIYSQTHCNIIQSSGVEVRGLRLTPIPKRAPVGTPLLQDYKFVPYSGIFSENASVRTCLRIVADNIRASAVRVVEFVENKDNVLSLTFSNLFSELVVQHKIVVYSLLELEVPNIVVKNKKIDSIEKNTSLVVLTDVSKKMLDQLPERLQEGAFILVRQPPDYYIEAIKQVDVILSHRSEKGFVFLLRKRVTYTKPRVVSVSDDLNWVSELQTSISNNERVLLISAGYPANGILGLINSLKLEYTICHISCVLVMDRDTKFDLEEKFFKEQLEKSLLVNILRDGVWGTYVYFHKESKNVNECEEVVGITDVGNTSNFYWKQGPPIKEGQIPSDHTLAYVYYTGLNVKDALLRRKPRNSFNLGIEFSGKRPSGERVMAIVKEAALASLVTSDNHLSWKIPDEWSLEDGATVPAAYCTVVYALIIIGKLKAGQTVLIHAGGGGVEQAAINVAAYYNCTIYLRVNSMRRRNVLKRLYPSLQDRFVGVSLDSSFEQVIMKETKGKGVDVIVNSFPDEQLYAGLSCLSRGGKFFELGQHDVAKESILDIGSILGNRSFFCVNLDQIFGAPAWRKKQLQHALCEGIRMKYIKPLPRRVYESDMVKDALTCMATDKHSIKVIVKMRDEKQNMLDRLTLPARPKFYCNSDKVYVLVGGLGGFGLQIADWLVTRGARKLVLVTRNGVATDYQNFKIKSWEEDGIHVVVSQYNLETVEGCCRLFKKAHALGSVDGIFNLAIVLNDRLFKNQTKDTFTSVLIPKLVVTKNLDLASRLHCPNLRCFVVFSSIISGKGNIGQSNYGMANSAMEEICVMRKNEGYPALAIQWGMIGDVGLLEDHNTKLYTLEVVAGVVKQKIASCLQVLDVLLDSDEVIVASSVLANTSDNQSKEVYILGGIANILGLNLKHISLHSSLPQIGMDSITSVEIKQFLEQQFEMFKSVRELMNTTLSQLKEEQMRKKV